MNTLVERYSGEAARQYEAKRSGSSKWAREHEAVASLLKGVTGTVLDCPVGTGRFLPLYREMELGCIGVDPSDDMLEQAAQRATNILMNGDVRDIPLDDGTVGASVCIRLLNWLNPDDVSSALSELARVTDGPIIAGIRTTEATKERPERIWHHGARDFATRLSDIGLVMEESRIVDRGPGIYAIHRLVKV